MCEHITQDLTLINNKGVQNIEGQSNNDHYNTALKKNSMLPECYLKC
jgi:hypothetical protein